MDIILFLLIKFPGLVITVENNPDWIAVNLLSSQIIVNNGDEVV